MSNILTCVMGAKICMLTHSMQTFLMETSYKKYFYTRGMDKYDYAFYSLFSFKLAFIWFETSIKNHVDCCYAMSLFTQRQIKPKFKKVHS